jgi:hypothetical protein
MNTFAGQEHTSNIRFRRATEGIDRLRQGSIELPPVTLSLIETPVAPQTNIGFDGIIEATGRGSATRYAFRYEPSNSPRWLKLAQTYIRAIAEQQGMPPLIIVPYLSEEALRELEENDISGIDLCGNGVLIAPEFRIWRTGYPNQYKDTRPIRNPYRGDSSIFARCFLLRPSFDSLSALQEFAQERTFGAYQHDAIHSLALSTASKVVQALVDEMIVAKQGNAINLKDPRRLLLLLRRGVSKTNRPALLGKTSLNVEQIWERLADAANIRSVATGMASAGHYRVLSGVDALSLYVDDLDGVRDLLEIRATRAFSNLQIFEERKQSVYFDARSEGNIRWASPIQTWQELTMAGPREQEAAEELERLLLNGQGETL